MGNVGRITKNFPRTSYKIAASNASLVSAVFKEVSEVFQGASGVSGAFYEDSLGSWVLQRISWGPRGVPGAFHGISGKFQGISAGFSGFPGSPRSFRGVPGVLQGFANTSHDVAETFEGVPAGFRGHQERSSSL